MERRQKKWKLWRIGAVQSAEAYAIAVAACKFCTFCSVSCFKNFVWNLSKVLENGCYCCVLPIRIGFWVLPYL